MKIIKVNNLKSFFFFRYLLIITLCFLTIFVTGRIADMDVLLGWQKYNASGTSTTVALNAFSLVGNLGNRYLLIGLLGILFSYLLYLLLRNYIDRKNFLLWQIVLCAPGLLIYSNSPTKESLFIYPCLLFLNILCNYLSNNSIKIFNIIFAIFLLILMFAIRGDQSIPYILLFLFSIFLKYINVGEIKMKLKFLNSLRNAFFISVFMNIIFYFLFPNFIDGISSYLENSFGVSENIYRPNIFDGYNQALKIFQLQYLSLFPTLGEILQTPYKLVIMVDSLILIGVFIKSWSKLFN